MHRETIKSTGDSSLSVAWTSFGLIVLLVLIVGLSNLLYNRYGINHSGYIAFLLYILVGVYVYRRKIMRYEYLLMDSVLIFESIIGKRNREIMSVSLGSVLYFCPLSYEKLDEDTNYKSHYIIFNKRSSKAWVLAFKEIRTIHRIIFEPSDKLVELIKKG